MSRIATPCACVLYSVARSRSIWTLMQCPRKNVDTVSVVGAYNPPPEVLKLREASNKLLQSVHVKVPVALFLRGFVGEFSLLGHRIVEKFEQVNFILAN